MTRVIITGGGTAGHTNPGIAIAQALVAQGLAAEDIGFIGGQRGSEATAVPAAGFAIEVLPGRGIRRSLRPDGIRDNLGAGWALLRALWGAWRLIRKRRPDVVVCLGGYAAFAATAVAVLSRIPVIISEQNARASAVNRLMARFARRCCLPYPDTDLPRGILTGNPIRAEVLAAIERAEPGQSRAVLGLADPVEATSVGGRARRVVAIWSGSLGARRINEVALGLAHRWADRDDVAIHHVVGRRDWPDFEPRAADFAGTPLQYQVVEYEDRMADVLTAADVALTRAGASTTAELAVAGLPAVLVPLPGAPRDHQRANAGELAAVGGGIILDDAEVTVERVAALLEPLLDDDEARHTMAAAAASVGRRDAASAVARIVLEAGGIRLPEVAA